MRILYVLALISILPLVSEAGAQDPVFSLPLNEGAGQTVQVPSNPGIVGNFIGIGGEWTDDVPENFVSGSAYRNSGVGGTAIVISGADLPNLGILDNFTITCWINVRAAKNYSRIVSKADKEMEAFFDFRIDEAADGSNNIVLALRSGSVVKGGYIEKAFEAQSEPVNLSEGWVFLAVVRDAESGEITFYKGNPASTTLTAIGTDKGPRGSVQTGNKNLMIGNIEVNMDRAPDADFSDIRITREAMTPEELNAVRKAAFKH
jgi:hypothetical protein